MPMHLMKDTLATGVEKPPWRKDKIHTQLVNNFGVPDLCNRDVCTCLMKRKQTLMHQE